MFGRLIRALGALAVLVVLVAALPWFLVAFVGNPYPPEGFSWAAPLTEGALIGLLATIAWGFWAQMMLCLVVEVAHATRGALRRTGPPVAAAASVPVAFGGQQQLIRILVNAVVAVAVTGSVAVAGGAANASTTTAAPPSAPGVSMSAAVLDGPGRVAEPHHVGKGSAQQSAGLRVAHVARGDTLWALAEKHLGSGERWSQVADLNRGRPMVDGRPFRSADLIQPGWELLMPADSAGLPLAPVSPPRADQPSHQVTVQPGDTLSQIADDELGDPTRWTQIAKANDDVVADPDVITPGTELVIPAQPTAAQQVAAPAQSPDTGRDVPDSRPAPPAVETPEPPPVVEPATKGPAESPEAPPPPQTAPQQAQEEPQGVRSAPDSAEEDAVSVQTVAGVGALLAAGVLGLVAVRRTNQRRRRRVGQATPQPPAEAVAVEHELRGVADPMSVDLVDRALRGLVVDCEQTQQPLPVVRAGRLTADQFELYLAEPARLPAPWVDTAAGTVWMLPAEAAGDLDVDTDQVVAPYPSLVTIGVDADAGHVFLDLEHLGALGITGDPVQVREVLAALAVELATSSWADDLQVTIVGAYPELEDVLETGRVRYLPAVGHLLDDLAGRAGRDRETLAAAGVEDLNQARVDGVAAAVWTPEIVLLTGELSQGQRQRLSDLVEVLPRVAVATAHQGEPVAEWALRLEDEMAVIDPIGLRVRPQRIDVDTYTQILELVAVATEDPVTTGAAVPAEVTLRDLPAPGDGAAVGAADIAAPVGSAWNWVAAADDEESETSGDVGVHDPVRSIVEDLPIPPVAVADTPVAAAADTAPTDDVDVDTGVSESAQVKPLPRRAPQIQLLGPVDVDHTHGPQVEARRRQTVTELAAFLSLHPNAGRRAVAEAVWHGRDVSDSTRWSTMSRLRRWLGEAVDGSGQWYLPHFEADDQYGFDQAVQSDWDQWMRLLPHGATSATTEHLEQALDLVRGQPFANAPRNRYDWADPVKETMIEAIAEAALELARRRLMEGRWRAAEQAAVAGLSVEPVMEQLWRMRIYAAHSSGNHTGVREAVDRLLVIADRVGGDLEPETEELLQQLTSDELPTRRSAAEL